MIGLGGSVVAESKVTEAVRSSVEALINVHGCGQFHTEVGDRPVPHIAILVAEQFLPLGVRTADDVPLDGESGHAALEEAVEHGALRVGGIGFHGSVPDELAHEALSEHLIIHAQLFLAAAVRQQHLAPDGEVFVSAHLREKLDITAAELHEKTASLRRGQQGLQAFKADRVVGREGGSGIVDQTGVQRPAQSGGIPGVVRYVTEGQLRRGCGPARQLPEESDHLGFCHDAVRREPSAAGAVGEAGLKCPEHRRIIVRSGVDVAEGNDIPRGFRLSRILPQAQDRFAAAQRRVRRGCGHGQRAQQQSQRQQERQKTCPFHTSTSFRTVFRLCGQRRHRKRRSHWLAASNFRPSKNAVDGASISYLPLTLAKPGLFVKKKNGRLF